MPIARNIHSSNMAALRLTFANFLLLLQVVYGIYSYNSLEKNPLQEDIIKKLQDVRLPTYRDEEIHPSLYDLDDVYESQIPPPPTVDDVKDIYGKPEDYSIVEGVGQPEDKSLKTNDVKDTLNLNEFIDPHHLSDEQYLKLSSFFREQLGANDDEDDDSIKEKLRRVSKIQEKLKEILEDQPSGLNGSFDGDREQVKNSAEETSFPIQTGQKETPQKYQLGDEDQDYFNGMPKLKILIKLKNLDSEKQANEETHSTLTISSSNGNIDIGKRIPDLPSFSRFESSKIENIGSQENKPLVPFLTSEPSNNNEKLNMPRSLNLHFIQTNPNAFILLKHLTDVVKEKSAVDALERGPEKQFLPTNYFVDQPNMTPWPNSKLTLVKVRNQKPQSQLHPLYFSDGNSDLVEHLLNHLHDSEDFEDDSTPSTITQEFDNKANDNVYQRQTLGERQDLPMFINKILANLVRSSTENGGLQPIPTPPSPPQKSAEENIPVHLRPAIFPLALLKK